MTKTPITKHPAYVMGKKDYRLNFGKNMNPYKAGSEDYNLYERGWKQCLHSSPNEYSSFVHAGESEEEPIKTFKLLSEEQLRVKEAYKKLK